MIDSPSDVPGAYTRTFNVLYNIVHSLNELIISDNIAFANNAAPSEPSNGVRRVLLFPSIGHFANTMIAPLRMTGLPCGWDFPIASYL